MKNNFIVDIYSESSRQPPKEHRSRKSVRQSFNSRYEFYIFETKFPVKKIISYKTAGNKTSESDKKYLVIVV